METKRWWQSRTYWVNFVSGLVALATVFGLDVDIPPEQQLKLVGGIMVAVNAANAWLRTHSTKKITPPDA